ncbi:MAG: hypothetical protein IJX17_03645 [Clostridia bacterium]|nr:hypothetical protein [Clostridia bacterium]
MLKKLLKYELIGSFKVLSIFYGIALFFGILTRIFLSFKNSMFLYVIGQICLGTTISMIVNIIINNLMRLWVRFRQGFFGDESYLTHTLPIKKDTLYLSKFLIGLVTIFVSCLVIILTLFIALYSNDNIELFKSIFMPNSNYKNNLIWALVLFIFVFYLEMVNVMQCGYFGIILGHKKNNKKIGFSVLFSFVCFIVGQLIVIALMCLVDLLSFDLIDILITTEMIEFSILILVILLCAVFYLSVITLCYYLCTKCFKKGVNVD